MPSVLVGQQLSARIGQTTVRHPIWSHRDGLSIAWLPLLVLREVFLGLAEDHVIAAGPALDRHHFAFDLDGIGRHQSLRCPLECLAEGLSLEWLAIPAGDLR